MILWHHAKLPLALSGDRGIPRNFAGFRDRADGGFFRFCDTSSETKTSKQSGKQQDNMALHEPHHNGHPSSCKPAKLAPEKIRIKRQFVLGFVSIT